MQSNYYSTTGMTTPQRNQLGSEMNHLYLSPSHQQSNQLGGFLRRNERIDWRRIAAVDVERIAREMDFQVLQENLEQITLCNIDGEVDTRTMDPNFLKLYKIAQLTIEYLLICQDQISVQLGDYDQLKNKNYHEQEDARRYIEKLKNELIDTKKESRKRRKMLETQQRMLMAQNSNYHTCPVCTHAFLSYAYLQAHISRRHPDYDGKRKREHDVDIEKEIQRLKETLNNKDHELQLTKAQKAAIEEKITDREKQIRQLRDEIQTLNTKISILEDRYSVMRTNTQTNSPSSHRNDRDVSELIKENKSLRAEIEQLKHALQQSENDRKKEEKLRRRLEQENSTLKENLQLLNKASGDKGQLTQELLASQNKYNDEKLRRKELQDQNQELQTQLAQYKTQPPTVPERKSPAPSQRVDESPIQTRPTRVVKTTDIMLPEYCPKLVDKLRDNPKFLTKYRDEAKKQFVSELEDYENLGIIETDTRLTDLDYRTKMEVVLQTRRAIQEDLPNFERIRADISRTLDRLVTERLDVRRSITSVRSTGSKLVTFEDEYQRKKHAPSTTYDQTKKQTLDHHVVQSKTKYDHLRPAVNSNLSDEDVTISNANESDDDEDTQPTKPGVRTDIQPSPRKNPPTTKPTSGVSALVAQSVKPSTTTTTTTAAPSTVSALVKQPIVKAKPTTESFASDSENESPLPSPVKPKTQPTNLNDKRRIIEQKIQESNAKGQKPGLNAIPQGFLPSRESLATQNTNENDDEETETLTTLHTNPIQKPSNGHLPQIIGRESMNNHHLSSGEVSQHTYDSIWKSQNGKNPDPRRPATADSAKTSNLDSDEHSEEENSN